MERRKYTMKTWLITGCSSGLGKSLAQAVLEHGDQVIVTARNPETVQDVRKDAALLLIFHPLQH